MLRHFQTFSVSESWTKELGPWLADSSLFFFFSGASLDVSCHQHTRHFSISHSHWQKRRHWRLLLKAYNMLQLCLQAMLCTVCLHAHYARSSHWFSLLCFKIITPFLCPSRLCVTQRHIFVCTVVLHNSEHYASDTTLNERNEILSCARWVSNRIGHSSACHWYQRTASFPV